MPQIAEYFSSKDMSFRLLSPENTLSLPNLVTPVINTSSKMYPEF